VRGALVFFTAFAFLFQSLIIQTHIHGALGDRAGLSGLLAKISASDEQAAPSKASGNQKLPKDDEGRCPVCQAAQSAGAFLAPAAIVVLLPWQNISLVPLLLANETHTNAASHDWRGRAPPSA
jgi:hypothetical protein